MLVNERENMGFIKAFTGALSGARGNSFIQQAIARGMQAAGCFINGMSQPNTQPSYQPNFGAVTNNNVQN